MAYVVKHGSGRSPYWYAVFRDETGNRRRRSTKLTSRSKALEMARGLEKAALEARRQTLTEARTRQLLGEILQSVSGETFRVFTVAQWLDHFVKGKRQSRSVRTARWHEQVAAEFISFLGHRANLNIAAITSADIAAFRSHRQSRVASASNT